jgi:hypothetical protein
MSAIVAVDATSMPKSDSWRQLSTEHKKPIRAGRHPDVRVAVHFGLLDLQ